MSDFREALTPYRPYERGDRTVSSYPVNQPTPPCVRLNDALSQRMES